MTADETLSLVLLLAVFALAIWRDVNVGLVALPAGLLLAKITGVPGEKALAAFPVQIVVLIIGVMYLFGHAQRSGAIDRLVHLVIRASGGRDWMLPWTMFLVGALLSAIGTLPSATVAIVLPIAMRLARNRGMDPVIMAVVACAGAGVGGFSPLSPWGAIVRQLAEKQGADFSPGGLFLGLAAIKTCTAILTYLLLKKFIRRGKTTPAPQLAAATTQNAKPTPPDSPPTGTGQTPATPEHDGTTTPPTGTGRTPARPEERGPGVSSPLRGYELGSMVGIGAFLVMVLALGMNPLFASLLVGLVLHLVFKPDTRRVIGDLPWGVILLTSGVLVYVGVLERVGTLDTLAGHLGGIDAALLTVLAIAYLAALFATVESSTVAVLGVIIPLTATALPHQSSAGFTALLIAICGVIGAVGISPMHLGGGLVLANTSEEENPRVFRWLLGISLAAAAVLPLLLLLVPLAVGV
ncbi:SLC13 family permease [Actinomadura algeriensis]|uniref:Na+/H+ antiporter NhaD/arsenite permease-like protein n=1 Tax=Actinomadura algeriensis TaxID=1679523 RepID=A0ABR9JJQ9_9ACTN|nr:SLC13 family permease [Actinomadura algeriensis]MBE1530699.1 Na+/H+ antiporter NhaD/arsenite permease-like protein [Actinomadura algeriensis]